MTVVAAIADGGAGARPAPADPGFHREKDRARTFGERPRDRSS
jgi:hypothetical protein